MFLRPLFLALSCLLAVANAGPVLDRTARDTSAAADNDVYHDGLYAWPPPLPRAREGREGIDVDAVRQVREAGREGGRQAAMDITLVGGKMAGTHDDY